jgi:hypothetical protein
MTPDERHFLARRILVRLALYAVAVITPASFIAGFICGSW